MSDQVETALIHGIHDPFPSSFAVSYPLCVIGDKRHGLVDGFGDPVIDPHSVDPDEGVDDLFLQGISATEAGSA